jgi:hypothetical protein
MRWKRKAGCIEKAYRKRNGIKLYTSVNKPNRNVQFISPCHVKMVYMCYYYPANSRSIHRCRSLDERYWSTTWAQMSPPSNDNYFPTFFVGARMDPQVSQIVACARGRLISGSAGLCFQVDVEERHPGICSSRDPQKRSPFNNSPLTSSSVPNRRQLDE